MASELKKQKPNQQTPRVNELSKTLDQQFLLQIIENSYDSLFVTDKFGNVLLVNAGTGIFMNYKTEELIGKNVKSFVKKGIYEWSPTLEVIKTRSVVSGIMRNAHGVQHLVTSKPLLDEKGDIVLIITNGRNEDLEDNYMAALEIERKKVRRYKTEVEYLSEKVENKEPVAESQQMRNIIQLCNVIAKTDSTVMLIGETGTGKEVMARHIHRNSLRSKEPFIPVNCAAIPHELLESEFFGYARGPSREQIRKETWVV
ncbi:MAG: sigma 54-interacting transcriptional regulator [Desulfosporosinus sp.]|nr:sigma 54-interacting transcriptional regulator [Desulfosporosinus sp.]